MFADRTQRNLLQCLVIVSIFSIRKIRSFLTRPDRDRIGCSQLEHAESGRQWRRELETLIEISGILTQPIEFGRKFDLMLAALARTAGADRAALRTLDQAGTGLTLTTAWPSEISPDGTIPEVALRLTQTDCPMVQAFSKREVLVIGDSNLLENPLPDYYSPLSRSLLICPVQEGERTLGVLGFTSTAVDNFNLQTVRVMTAITSTIGVLMENARLQEERMLSDDKIVRLAQALEFTDDAIVLVDADGSLEYMNTAAQKLAGDTSLVSQRGFDGVEEFDQDGASYQAERAMSQALEGGWSGEVRRLDKDGNRVYISFSTNHVTDSANRPMGHITVGRDVTKNRLMEHDLLQLNREREVEANIGRIVSYPLDMTDVFERFGSEFQKIIPFDRISILSVDIANQTWLMEFKFGDLRLIPEEREPTSFEGSITGMLVRSGSSKIYNSGSPEFSREETYQVKPIPDSTFTSFLGVPLMFGDEIVGVVILARAEKEFTPEEQLLTERIGSLLSGALANRALNTERDDAVIEAIENDARFRQIAENVQGGFWLSDLKPHKVLYASPALEHIWGFPAEILYSEPTKWMELIHPDDRERLNEAAKRAYESGEMYEEFRIIRSDGRQRWIASRGFPIRDENGEVYRIGGFVEDITERKEADLRLAETERMAYVGELSAGVAHEINNPLTSIMLYSQMMLDEDLPESIRSDLQVVSSQAFRAAKIVRSLLHFARKSDPELRPLNIDGLIRRSLEMKSHEFHVNNITVVEDIPLSLPNMMLDEYLIIQVLLNVLTNAEHACVTSHGRGEITVSVSVKDDILRVSIRDDGPGIPADQLGKIFDPFYTTKDVGSGTGLGLSVSLGIISQHDGKIWAESTEGVGTTFHIELPSTIDVSAADWDLDPRSVHGFRQLDDRQTYIGRGRQTGIEVNSG